MRNGPTWEALSQHEEEGFFLNRSHDDSGPLGEFKHLYRGADGHYYHDSKCQDRSSIPEENMYTRTTFKANSYSGDFTMKVTTFTDRDGRCPPQIERDLALVEFYHTKDVDPPTPWNHYY